MLAIIASWLFTDTLRTKPNPTEFQAGFLVSKTRIVDSTAISAGRRTGFSVQLYYFTTTLSLAARCSDSSL
ncbi:hypothetical protein B0H19DRAFT_1103522 [Mycena capillaripes]|nr:hypothetical protein B0H19DRAFT_1103522 [Mycena capillaripes]